MNGFAKMLVEDRRLLILKALAASVKYTGAASLLASFLSGFGRAVSHDAIAGDLAWLGEQGLVEAHEISGEWIATLTLRGLDVAEGRAGCPGVRRPKPGET